MSPNQRRSSLPEGERADARLRAGRLGEPELGHLARRLALLHESESVDPDAARKAGPDVLAARACALRDDASAIEAEHPKLAAAFRIVADIQARFVAAHAEWIQQRIDDHRIRVGAHDLHLENVWIDDQGNVTLFDDENGRRDCARSGRDGCVPVAGLSVDLASRGHPELAERLIAAYAGESDDYALYRVVDHHERDRACGRAREQLRAASASDATVAARAAPAADALRLLDFACADVRRPLQPPVVMTLGGLVASGKSTVARAVADLMASLRIVGDHVRGRRAAARALAKRPKTTSHRIHT